MTTPSAPIPVRPPVPVPTQPEEKRNEQGNPLDNAQAAASRHAGVASVQGVATVK